MIINLNVSGGQRLSLMASSGAALLQRAVKASFGFLCATFAQWRQKHLLAPPDN